MIQTGLAAVKQISPNIYMVVLLALFIAKEVISMTFKGIMVLRKINGGNGKKKDETQRLPCLQNPLFTIPWETHKQEAHDTKLSTDRVESGVKKLVEQSIIRTTQSKRQTEEAVKQTGLLEKIQKNGSATKK